MAFDTTTSSQSLPEVTESRLTRQIEIKRAQPRGAGTLPNKYPTNNNNQMRNNQGGMGNMGGMNGGAGNGMMGMGGMPGMMGMGMPGMGMGMGGGFDPNAMAMMYSNMMKGGMGMSFFIWSLPSIRRRIGVGPNGFCDEDS